MVLPNAIYPCRCVENTADCADSRHWIDDYKFNLKGLKCPVKKPFPGKEKKLVSGKKKS